jgi:hypothetical protein
MTEGTDQEFDDLLTFVGGLARESDRSAVILGAARLDVGLERLLKKVMAHHPGGQDDLFGPDRPLGSFSAKILLAYRLGLINRNVESLLQMIRKTRNEFAHSLETASLSDGPARSRAVEMGRLTSNKFGDRWNQLVQFMRDIAGDESKAIFCAVICALILALDNATSKDNIISVHTTARL